MANPEHIQILEKGWAAWNEWRGAHSNLVPDLSRADLPAIQPPMLDMIYKTIFKFRRFQGINFNGANLSGATLNGNLYGADFGGADLSNATLAGLNLNHSHFESANLTHTNLSAAKLQEANLSGANGRGAIFADANLEGADLTETNLNDADLRRANLTRTRLVRTNLEGADITNASIYGLSAWDVNTSGTLQSNLIISPEKSPVITVDNLEVAQFVYLLLNNQRIRDVINTLGQKAVLILGRFSPERKVVLDAIAAELRARGLLPIIFDFEKSQERDFTETVMVLAGLALFVIVDITNPASAPLELHATIPNYMIPFVPIIKAGEKPFSMFVDLQKFHWVLDIIEYDEPRNLIENFDRDVINPALEKHDELIAKRANGLRIKKLSQ